MYERINVLRQVVVLRFLRAACVADAFDEGRAHVFPCRMSFLDVFSLAYPRCCPVYSVLIYVPIRPCDVMGDNILDKPHIRVDRYGFVSIGMSPPTCLRCHNVMLLSTARPSSFQSSLLISPTRPPRLSMVQYSVPGKFE